MDSKSLKEYIINNNKYKDILEYIGCHSIQDYGDYYGCGLPDGDNKKSTILYKSNLICQMHSRGINGDIFDLVSYIYNTNFFKSLKKICDILEVDYHEKPKPKPNVLKILSTMNNMFQKKEEEEYIKIIDEDILKKYLTIGNYDFISDGIDIKTQKEFEIGFCIKDHLITIPIRDEIGDLVGVKARKTSWIDDYDFESKYIYIEKCPKSKLVYGIHKTYDYIKQKKICFVFESEKSVMKAWSLGIKNSVAIGGHTFSSRQIDILEKMGVEIVICFDKDVDEKFLQTEYKKFLNCSYVYDNEHILKEKESPIDSGLENFKKLVLNRRVLK